LEKPDGGYITIKADNLQQAIAISKDCPIFNLDETVYSPLYRGK